MIHLDPLPDPPPDQPSVIALEDRYAGAIIGHTINPQGPPRYAYSLNALARIISRQSNKSLEHARKDVMALVHAVTATHPDDHPHFIDDAISRPGIDKEKSLIVKPSVSDINGFKRH